MLNELLIKAFVNAARALSGNIRDTGYTGNGLKKLDFVIKDGDNTRTFTAISQNPQKVSTPALLARRGFTIVQIKDDDTGKLLGHVNVGENRFNSYTEPVPQPVEISDIMESLGDLAITDSSDIQISGASSAQFIPPDDKKAA